MPISPSINHSAVDSSDIELGQRQQNLQNLLDSVVEARSPVLKYVPKASRALAAEKLSTILDCVVSVPDNIDEWRRVLLFSYSCFRVPARGGKAHRSSLATKVNKLLFEYITLIGHQPSRATFFFAVRTLHTVIG